MKRFFFFFSLLVICAVNLHSQGEFRLEMDPKQRYTFSNDPEISCLAIKIEGINADLELSSYVYNFYEVKPQVFSQGNVKEFWYEIRVPKNTKWKQEVNFSLDGYKTQTHLVSFEGPKELQYIVITDPNKATSGYYYHRRVAREYFEKGDYDRAMAELKTAETTTTDVDMDELKVLIAEIDTIQRLYVAAQDSADMKNYYAAAQIYHNIASEFNNNDKTAYKLYNEMHKKYEDYTAVLYKEAEANYNQHRYTQATDFYQKYIDFHGNNKEMATSRLNDIKRNIQNKRVMPHVLYYQFDNNAPIGFGYGRFNDRKVGWFMNFSMNNEVFKLINDKWEPKDSKGNLIQTLDEKGYSLNKMDIVGKISNVPEINLALVGLSIPLVSPHPEKENQYFHIGKLVLPKFPALYLNIVPLSASLSFGYDKTKLYKKDDNGDKVYWDDNKHLDNNIGNYESEEYNTNPLFCYAPQVGLTLKWGRLALFYTFEYRYLVNERNTYKDAIRDNRSMFGIGFAW